MKLYRFSDYCYQVEHDGKVYRVLFGGAVVVREDATLQDWIKSVNPLVEECSCIQRGYNLFTDDTGTRMFAGNSSSSWDYLPVYVSCLQGSLYELFLGFPEGPSTRKDLMLEAFDITQRHICSNEERYPWLKFK